VEKADQGRGIRWVCFEAVIGEDLNAGGGCADVNAVAGIDQHDLMGSADCMRV
jgi:hypothetical protein